ncbi:MAG: UDP-N-acetylglucosamine 2-epimerase (non-hydrolyzing) [Ruminococcaceae bacterium]|nr:UDP-N-acetylglucosamine 2-epimerase (non-hydrolyzing) [Oscillospiraceae bacterium]
MAIKVLSIFGTRPEAIKMCPVVKELNKRKNINSVVCLTGQHREMLRQVMDVFKLKEDYNLDIMKPNQTLSMITASILEKMDDIISKEKPGLILVHGDTSTAFVAALAAFYHQIPIGHVEAGLRTYNLKSPYPEEFNRQAIDVMTEFYFAPTEKAKDTLLNEGKSENRVFVTGNTVIDALSTTVTDSYFNEHIEWAKDSRLILLTAHRRENIGEPMENIFKAVVKLTETFEDVKFIYPIHLNPRVREIADKYLKSNDKIRLIEPLDVFDFHNFMKRSYLIMTDSGEIQEEAPSLGKPVLVLRDTTERPEGINAGTLKLVGTDAVAIFNEAKLLLENENEYKKMSEAKNPYGDGTASCKIADIIETYFKE